MIQCLQILATESKKGIFEHGQTADLDIDSPLLWEDELVARCRYFRKRHQLYILELKQMVVFIGNSCAER